MQPKVEFSQVDHQIAQELVREAIFLLKQLIYY